MSTMTYSGLLYKTQTIGTYKTRYGNALTGISRHTRRIVGRQEAVTLTDNFMLEAFQNYPGEFDFRQLDHWSRSYYTQEGHMQTIQQVEHPIRGHKPDDASMEATDNYCKQYFANLPKVNSLDYKNDLDKVPFESTSAAGYNLTGKKGDEGNLQKAIDQAYATVQDCLRGNLQDAIDRSTPDMAFTRTQLTQLTEKLKIRNVFGQAFSYILLEGLTASPLMDMFSTEETFFFVGKDPRKYVPKLLEELMKDGRKILTFDWTAFDTSVEPWEIVDAFDLLESIINFPNTESFAAFEFCKILFINRKIAAPNGTIYFKERCVPSGSFFTMLIDSIVNWRRILYLHHRAYGTFPYRTSTQGDDAIASVPPTTTPEGMALTIPPHHTWVLNYLKCLSGESPSTTPFLQRRLKWGDFARDTVKVERLAIYPEYEVESGQISAFRARALWEDCNYESHVLGFATGYLESKYGIPIDVPNRFKLWWQVLFESGGH